MEHSGCAPFAVGAQIVDRGDAGAGEPFGALQLLRRDDRFDPALLTDESAGLAAL